jgi:hypothetical protein|uniref:Uncharacterized protein n=1 Tax=Candidatus Aramenus sulfurataquae TaxID=1326980 RepID=A0A0F2LP81_9CREN
MCNPKEVVRRNYEDLKGARLIKLGEGVYVGRNFLKDVLVYVEQDKGIFVHCVGDCFKGTGCVVYEAKGNLSKEEVAVEELGLSPLFPTRKASTALLSLLEASRVLGLKQLEVAYGFILDKVNEGALMDLDQ